MTTMTKSGRSARTNAIITTGAVLGILVLLNIIGLWAFGRVDLTDNQRYTLSEVSREAVRALDSVDVQVFISEDLPPTMSLGFGQERDIRGVDREFLDKLEEYASYSGGAMRIIRVSGDIEEKARQARLELFTGHEAAIEGGRLEFRKYALGATFQYRNQMEVFPLAVEPAYFEFEITKILLRLKEKYEKSLGMKDLLESGKALAEAVEACNKKIEGYEKPGAGGLSVIVGGGDRVSSLRIDRVDFKKQCDQVSGAIAKAEPFRGKNEYFEQLLSSARQYANLVDEVSRRLDEPQVRDAEIEALLESLQASGDLVSRDHDTLKNSPGRRAVGFLCGHDEFCPFADPQPLIRPEIAGLMGQRNPFVQQFANQAKAIEDQINAINEQIRRGLFVRRGFTVKRIGPGEDIPDDVAVLVVHGAQKPLSDRDLYNIDQFLLSGRTVIVFLKNWDVAVYNIRKGGEGFDFSDLHFDELERRATSANLDDFLAHHGVKVNRDLVLEPRSFEDITIVQVQKQGQFTLQSQRNFRYPLLPTFTDLDTSHVLVRRLAHVTLPFTSTLGVTDTARAKPEIEAIELIRSSEDAVATAESLELSPPRLLQQLSTMRPTGPHAVAVVLKGTLQSFYEGKEVPKRPEASDKDDERFPKPKPVDRPFRAQGSGRLLVVGSDLGLENLSARRVFEGFEMSQLASGTADFFLKLKDYISNYQNWQLRLTQIAPIVQANLDFLFNCLDWGLQEEALADIRSKGLVRRPLQTVSAGTQTVLSLGLIVGVPALFVLAGLARFVSRRKGS